MIKRAHSRWIIVEGGWRRRSVAALLGVCATLALPPFGLIPMLIPAFAGLYLLIAQAKRGRQAFLDGWWWGLGHFTAGLYWICISLYVEPEKFAWLTPFALFGLPSVLGIYTGLVSWLTAGLVARFPGDWPRRHYAGIALFVLFWAGAEYLRTFLFSGFPWNLIGYSATASLVLLQSASLVGIYGLGGALVLIATSPVLYVLPNPPRHALWFPVTLLAVMALFGIWRLDTHPTRLSAQRVRIVQAAVPESMKWDPKTVMAGLQKHVALTRAPGLDAIDLVLWPETAVPFYMEPDSPLSRDIGGILPAKTLLVTGGMRGRGDAADWQAWNTLFVLDHDGKIRAQYDKHHLVPFGEFVPLRGVLPVENIAGGQGDFTRGPGPATLDVPPLPPFSPLICYEAIFPDETTDGSGRARLLINVTNDAWFGVSTGPYQHLQMARMRAVETGLPLLRAANTGISAGFDPMGRELGRLPLETKGTLDLYIPMADGSDSLFGRYKLIAIIFMVVSCAVFTFSAGKPRQI